jgi:hypothetical protein
MSGINADNPAIIEELYDADAEIEWPQFGVKIIGAADRRKAFETLAIKPDIHPRRVFGEGNVWVVEALLSYGGNDYHAISVLEFLNGSIVRETSYWSDPAPGRAGWRHDAIPGPALSRFVHPLVAIAKVPEPEELEVDS